MTRKMSEILEAMGGEESMPEVKDQEFHGARTRYNDRLGIRLQSGRQGIGVGSRYAITVFNPNRGAPFFPFDNEKDLAAFQKSFEDALQQVRAAMAEHDKEYKAWSKARFDREMGA